MSVFHIYNQIVKKYLNFNSYYQVYKYFYYLDLQIIMHSINVQ